MPETNVNIDYQELLQNSIDFNIENYILKLNDCNEKFSELAVHDIRVRIRRFMTLLSMIKSITNLEFIPGISSKLKEQIIFFSPLRDVQVQLLKVQHLVYSFPVLYHYYHHLLEQEESYIATLQTGLRDLNINAFNKTILNLKLEINKFYKESSQVVLRPQDIVFQKYNAVIAMFKSSNREDVKSIHKVRLNFKKFRYSMEIIRPIILPESNETPENLPKPDLYLEMNEFQTVMGNIQDLTVFVSHLEKFSENQAQVSKEMFKPVIKELLFEREKFIDEFYINFVKFYGFWKPEYNS